MGKPACWRKTFECCAGTLHLGHRTRTRRWGQERTHGRGDEERLHAHVDETRDAADGVVGVERAENQVTGERRADGDFGRFKVAHFADHDDVGIAAQDTAQRGGEGEIDLGLDRDLQ